MNAYRVSARIDGRPPRWRGPLPEVDPVALDGLAGTAVDLVGQPLDVTLSERWDAFRERWAQTTFFLFDPDSWRT